MNEVTVNEAATRLMERAEELARSSLQGIEEAAKELAALADGNVAVISRARHLAQVRLEEHRSHDSKQIVALIRRAIEVGMSEWSMDETRPLA